MPLESSASNLSAETGLVHRPSAEGEHVSSLYCQRVTISSGRFAMIGDGSRIPPEGQETRIDLLVS
jgi:hypothetical protein